MYIQKRLFVRTHQTLRITPADGRIVALFDSQKGPLPTAPRG